MEKYILEALQKAVTTAVAATTLPPTAVKYVGRLFEKPSNYRWLEVIYIPNNIENEFWDSSKTYQGILRLILHWGMDDKGAYEPTTLINDIAASFAKGGKFADPGNNVIVRIDEVPNLLGILEEPPELLLPLSVRYRFFKA